MRLKRKGDTIINADIVAPETALGEFSDNITSQAKSEIVATYNHGSELLQVYEQYRNNLHIEGVVELLRQLERVYRAWDSEMFAIARTGGNEHD